MRTLYFCPVVSVFLTSFHRLMSAVRDWMSTIPHNVALVRIQNAFLKCAARGSLKIRDSKWRKKIAIWAPSQNFVGLYLPNWGMYRQSEKNLLSRNISSTCPHNMVDFGLLTAEIVSGVWGTPATFNGFHVFAVLLHGSQVVSVSQTLRRWTEGVEVKWSEVSRV